jgi:hypothetical protein
MALKQISPGVLVDSKGFVFKGTPDVGAHGKNAFSSHLFEKTGMTLPQFQQTQKQTAQENTFKQVAQDRAMFEEKQRGQEQDFLGRFTGAIQSLEPLDIMRERLAEDLNIAPTREAFTGLTKSVADLQNVLNTLPQQVAGETRGFDVNANQLARIQESRAQPIQQNLGQQATALGATGQVLGALEGELGQRLQTGVTQQQRQLQPFEVEGSLLSDRLAREVTGFNQDRESELNLLLNKI